MARQANAPRIVTVSMTSDERARVVRNPNERRRRRVPSLTSAGARAVGLAVALIGLLLIGWGLGDIAQSVAQPADLDLVRDAAAERTSLLTVIAHALSLAGSGYVIVPLAAACCAVAYRRGAATNAVAIALSTTGGVLIANVDKLLVGRPRPTAPHLEMVSSSSFPSGHATQATAFYLAVLIALRLRKPPPVVAVTAAVTAGVLILGIALSRVYLGVHYPSDVAAGVLLGAAWTLLVAALLRRDVTAVRNVRRG
jgi:membrane-associated phospholipid phosphatase